MDSRVHFLTDMPANATLAIYDYPRGIFRGALKKNNGI